MYKTCILKISLYVFIAITSLLKGQNLELNSVTPGFPCSSLSSLIKTVLVFADIPLNPSSKSSFDNGFMVHWLNNKELQFTVESERLMNDINRKSACPDEAYHDGADTPCDDSQPGEPHTQAL